MAFENIRLLPQTMSTIRSRSSREICTSVFIGDFRLTCPMIVSPMPDASSGFLVNKVIQAGGWGIIHRFQTIQEQVEEFIKTNRLACVAVGVTGDYLERTSSLFEAGARYFCLDTANGASILTVEAANNILNHYPTAKLILGNFITSSSLMSTLEKIEKISQIVGIRVGVAGGNVCTTRTETGIFLELSYCIEKAVYSLNDNSHTSHIKIIADGGISEPQEMNKALVLGASAVMCGSVFAASQDSPAERYYFTDEQKMCRLIRGAASASVQKEFKGEEPEYVEGTSKWIPETKPVEQIIKRFENGLRSCMSYLNCRTILELQNQYCNEGVFYES